LTRIVEEILFLLVAKLFDWPTVAIGICAGVVAWSRPSMLAMAAVTAGLAELTLMLVRGWPIRPYWLAVGFLAAVPWCALGFLLRSAILALIRRSRSGA
jgi:hypothetical protein